jgi:hypothetical protein
MQQRSMKGASVTMNPNRPSSFEAIPSELLAAHGLQRNHAAASCFNCTDPAALRIPTSGIDHPADYQIKWDTAGHLLQRIHDQGAIDPIIVTRRPGHCEFVLIDGLHRLLVSIAIGFPSMPANLISYEMATCRGFR